MMHSWLWICIILSAKDGNRPLFFFGFFGVCKTSLLIQPRVGFLLYVVQEYKDQVLPEGNVGRRVSKDNRNLSCKPTKI
jgi:hypothetical protein